MFSATKTDLRLLLECLKYQMKWPGSQKQALLTIISICKQNGLIYSSEYTHMTQKYDLPQTNLKIFYFNDTFDVFNDLSVSDQYVEFFREIGGISFIYNLSKSSTFSQVKETALFTLASLAELQGLYAVCVYIKMWFYICIVLGFNYKHILSLQRAVNRHCAERRRFGT